MKDAIKIDWMIDQQKLKIILTEKVGDLQGYINSINGNEYDELFVREVDLKSHDPKLRPPIKKLENNLRVSIYTILKSFKNEKFFSDWWALKKDSSMVENVEHFIDTKWLKKTELSEKFIKYVLGSFNRELYEDDEQNDKGNDVSDGFGKSKKNLQS